MRIVHVAKAPLTKGLVLGAQEQILYLAAAQQAQGFDIAVMTDAEGPFTEVCRERGVPVIVAPSLGMPAAINPRRGGALQVTETKHSNIGAGLIRKFADFRPDIIHCHDEMSVASAMAAGGDMNIPCVLTLHLPLTPLLYPLWTAGKFSILCIWKSRFDALKIYETPESGLYYVPAGTVSCMYPYEILDEGPNLMAVGGVSDEKGIHGALLAMVELRRRRGRGCPALDIYGGGALLEYYKETASMLGLGDIVKFHGIRPDVLSRYRGSNILVMPSRVEAGPLVVLEALSRGMPIVATDVGDVAEMLPDQQYGRVVPKDSIMMLVDAIDATLSDVADSRFDPGLLIERHRNLYTVEKMAEGIHSVYNDILTGRPINTSLRGATSAGADK